MKGASLKLTVGTLTYNGGEQYPSAIQLKVKGGDLREYALEDGQNSNVPAVITYSNNINKGTATICLTGSDGVSIKKTYSIKAADIANGISISSTDSAVWAVKGALPEFSVDWNDLGIIEGQDYTVSYKNNKKFGQGSFEIKGKGNFTGTVKGLDSQKFNVTKAELGSDAHIAAVTAYDGAKVSQVKVTVLDLYGDVVPTSKYTINVYASGSETPLAKSTKLVATSNPYTVEVVTKGNDDITESTTADVEVAANLSKASVSVAKGFEKTYTGDLIELDPDEDFVYRNGTTGKITVTYKVGKDKVTLNQGEDFRVAGYTNNLKKGNMTVTIEGIGNYSGTKTFKVKIAAKTLK